MARRKPAHVHGVMAIDKPAGMTSRQVVNRVGWLLGEKRAGHTGTLDPDATGVLVLAFGHATKAIRWLTDTPKSYRTTVRFGSATSTDDAQGDVVETAPIPGAWDQETLLSTANRELGTIAQVPPAVSALKRDGVRDYERVRKGETIIRTARPVRLDSVQLLGMTDTEATFELTCGAGFYVRAWARDLGKAMGSAAHLTTLRRTHCSGFDVDECVPSETFAAMKRGDAEAHLRTTVRCLRRVLSETSVDEQATARLRHGQKVWVPQSDLRIGGELLVTGPGDVPICIAEVLVSASGTGGVLRVIRGLAAATVPAIETA